MNTLLHIVAGSTRGGCERNALCLIQRAPHLQHHVLVLADVGGMSAEFKEAGAAVHHANVLARPGGQIVRRVREQVQRFPPDGVIAWHGMVALPEILHSLHDFRGRVLVHGGNPAHSLPRWVDWRYRLREWQLGNRSSATYVCCSQYVADSFESSGYLRRFSRTVIPNGVMPLNGPAHVPRAIGSGEPFTVGMLARLDVIKDHATLLRAFSLIVREWPAARLELAGDGERREALTNLAGELGIAERVTFLGAVNDVYSVMRRWDVFAYATTKREGLGNALAEAMMLGLPCVATDVGPIRELAGTPAVVRLVLPGEPVGLCRAILEAVQSIEERKRLGQGSHERAETQFSAARYAQSYLNLFDPPNGQTVIRKS